MDYYLYYIYKITIINYLVRKYTNNCNIKLSSFEEIIRNIENSKKNYINNKSNEIIIIN